MTPFPKDVQEAAAKAASAYLEVGADGEPLCLIIGRVIVAERQRCEEVAAEWLAVYEAKARGPKRTAAILAAHNIRVEISQPFILPHPLRESGT